MYDFQLAVDAFRIANGISDDDTATPEDLDNLYSSINLEALNR